MFKKKHEFKPDRTGTSFWSKLYITRKQRMRILKWSLYALALLVLSLIQDVILYGMPVDLVPAGILLCGLLLQPEPCSLFCLLSSLFYYFSGSAPGPYVIGVLTVIGLFLCVFRHAYLRKSAGSILLCAGIGVLVYEALLLGLGLFLNLIGTSRLRFFLLTAVFSAAALPLMYPLLVSIGKIGGESWKD